jgi:hypothetical protein
LRASSFAKATADRMADTAAIAPYLRFAKDRRPVRAPGLQWNIGDR